MAMCEAFISKNKDFLLMKIEIVQNVCFPSNLTKLSRGSRLQSFLASRPYLLYPHHIISSGKRVNHGGRLL